MAEKTGKTWVRLVSMYQGAGRLKQEVYFYDQPNMVSMPEATMSYPSFLRTFGIRLKEDLMYSFRAKATARQVPVGRKK